MEEHHTQFLQLRTQRDMIADLIARLDTLHSQDEVEAALSETFSQAPDNIIADANDYYATLNAQLYKHILKDYKHKHEGICLWRFFKTLSGDQLALPYAPHSPLEMMDFLVRMFFYSDPLDDLTCIFIPVYDQEITKYVDWIKTYFYNVNYPTSLLWLYALDSSLASFFPSEIVYLGKRVESEDNSIMIPDFSYPDTVLFKRFSAGTDHFVTLHGRDANNEFQQIFGFLQEEYRDRCLSRTAKQDHYSGHKDDGRQWERFEEVLQFGVSDRHECGCISFSDLRNSTNFLNQHGKNVFRNIIQQPFFEKTKLVSRKYRGRIDKFMGDNVMCVFLDPTKADTSDDLDPILNNFFAIFALCRILLQLLIDRGIEESQLGLRSGISYGTEILRSNLGNEIVRDFTVTGETVNLAARLEHIGFHELIVHNQDYFKEAIERFPQVSEVLGILKVDEDVNEATQTLIRDYTRYQNIISNLQELEKVRFDIRFNQDLYLLLKEHFHRKGYQQLNIEQADIHGYEEFNVERFTFRFYHSYYNPKGFSNFEKIWILPLLPDTLLHLDIERIR